MYYGFDVGGTKIEFGAFDQNLTRLATERLPTPKNSYNELLTVLTDLIAKYDNKLGVKGHVGIGIPGMEQVQDQTILTVNIPSASGQNLRADLEAKIGRKIALNNDANCFALSEAWDEQLRHEKIVLGLILGTGFGGGLVVDGQVLSGANHVAGEVGHARLPVDAWLALGENAPLFACGCGKKGCLDNYLSGRGFEQLYQHFYQTPKKATEIITHFRDGLKDEVEFVDKYLDMMAMSLASIFTSLDPDVVVLGGGLSNFDELYTQLPKRLPDHLLSVAKAPKIIKANYGDAGGVRGAAFLNLPTKS